ncbi:MAG: ribosome silencing factor [Elusimicrobiota bacterium]
MEITKKKNARSLTKEMAQYLDQRKAEDVKIIDVRGICDITDYMILATGRSTMHVVRTAHDLRGHFSDAGVHTLHREGVYKESRWTVLDYGDLIVHICTREARMHYSLDENWHGSKNVKWEKAHDQK